MADGDDDMEKTEEPTSKRIEDAVKKGQVAFSREVTNFLMFLVLALLIVWFIPSFAPDAKVFLRRFLESPHDILISYQTINEFIFDTLMNAALIFILPIAATIFVAIFSSFIQNGFVISTEPLMPKLEKISLFKGIKRMFSLKSIVEFIKGIFKITIVAVAAYFVFMGDIEAVLTAPSMSFKGIVELMAGIGFKIVLSAAVFIFFIAVIDYSYQKFEYMKNLRMTRQEIKEEYKQSEGDPQIKAKLKQIREERARRRMISAVPDADVVIRNPTHYAVALKYKQDQDMRAPVVVALGADNIALKIIEIADENKVAVVTNRALARTLYETAELDEEIPIEQYKAVAEIIAYVFGLRKDKKVA